MRKRYLLWLLLPGLLLPLNDARAGEDDEEGLRFNLSGFISADIRYAIPQMNPFWCVKSGARWRKGWCHGATNVSDIKNGFTRNENIARLRLTVRSGDYKGVAEIDFVWTGFARQPDDLGGVIEREKIDPFRIEAHALYFDVTDFLFKGLDLRIGKQIVTWGKADMFNPTSNINSLDLEDPLLFGDRVSNNMIRLDYNPRSDWILTFVWVPIFKPNQLPASAAIALQGVDRIPMASTAIRRRLHVERDFADQLLMMPTVVTRAVPILPDTSIENSQVAFKVAGKLAKMDFSLSYYYGRSGIPQPFVERVFGDDPSFLDARTSLMYPRMHVIGFDWAGQIPLGRKAKGRDLGFWFELAVIFPQRVVMPIYNNHVPVIGTGEYDYDGDGVPGGTPPTIVDSRPFAKWVLGFDYTFTKWLFMNIQWIHGFIDEFGAGDWFHKSFVPTAGMMDLDTNNDGEDDLIALMDCNIGGNTDGRLCAKEYLRPRLGDYLVAGLDFKFYRDKMLLRLFFILDITGIYLEEFRATGRPTEGERRRRYYHPFHPDGFSMILYPQWTWSIAAGAELSLGALWYFGKRHTKFGAPETGGSMVFAKGKFSF